MEIALSDKGNGVFQKDIAVHQDISLKYLDNIIASLKTAGLIVNKKGRKSGYILARKPSEIRILDIYKAFEPGISIVDCMSEAYNCKFSGTCGARNFWTGLNNAISGYFESNTLEDLLHGSKE